MCKQKYNVYHLVKFLLYLDMKNYDNVMMIIMVVLLVYDCHQTTRKVHAPGVAVTCGVMGGLFIVGCTAWYVGDVDLSMNEEVIGVDFSVYGTGYIGRYQVIIIDT